MQHTDKMTLEQFSELVRDALNNLYDTVNLGQHALIDILTPNGQAVVQRSRQLRQILLNSIEQLRPETGTPAQSPDWRAYYILEKRYIDGMNTNQIIQELSISRAQFFRDQARVLDILIEQLWQNIHQSVSQESASSIEPLYETEQALVSELKLEILDIVTLIHELKPIIEVILANKHIAFIYDMKTTSIVLPLDRVIFRQMFLAAINTLVSVNQDGRINIEISTEDEHTEIILEYSKTQAELDPQQMAIARKLASHLDAEIQLEQKTTGKSIKLNWSNQMKRQSLLVVDDNTDIAKLFKRYIGVLGWQVKGVQSVAEALQFLETTIPTVIILDVMMPDADGWELLLKLKANSDTQAIPVIVCSAVHNQETAIALGANGYLAKPVTQENITTVLQALIHN
jgi:CheY-like chemotaxis protein